MPQKPAMVCMIRQGLMSKSPMDYTTWHQRHFDTGESVRELGEKVKAFARSKRRCAEVDDDENGENRD